MTDVFLSYASGDRYRVEPLVEHLKSLGWSVWWDRDLVAGPSFDEEIERAIEQASCVVVAWSEASIASKWVRAEANDGLEREILVPILLDDVRPPLVFRAAQTANLIGWPERTPDTEFNALITGIRDVVEPSEDQRSLIEAAISSRSVAVLRFVDMSSEQDQSPLCDGIAEEILNRLAYIRDLKVIARTSSFRFDPTRADVREIGRSLGVLYVLEGSVKTAGDQVRITARLIECEGGSHRWSESYTRTLVDLFTLYDEVSDAITRELDLILSGRRPETSQPTHSEEALRLVMQARFKLDETGDPSASFSLVDRALQLDPDYAEAHLIKGSLFYWLAGAYYEPAAATELRETPETNFLAAKKSLDKALLLDSNLAEAHWLTGLVRAYLEVDWGLAAESWRQADRLRGYPMKYQLLCMAGYYEKAERNCLLNLERDPLNVNPRFWHGRILDRLGRIDDATAEYERALDLAPHHQVLFFDVLEHLLLYVKDVDRAERFLGEAKCSDNLRSWARARIAHERGDSRQLRSLVEAWSAHRETGYARPLAIERGYYELGDYGQHIKWFAVREREKDTLPFVLMELGDRPDYWDRLSEWVLERPAEARSRLELVNEHRSLVDQITEKLVLPRDFVE